MPDSEPTHRLDGMRAIVQSGYGGPSDLTLRELERPTPRAGEVLLRVKASSINRADWYVATGTPFPVRFWWGLFKPTLPVAGLDVAGVVEAVGSGVTTFKPGDEVYGEIRQAWAEYVCVDAAKLARRPQSVSWEEAAALPIAGVTALQALRDVAKVQPGQQVLVIGASGGVGTFAVQVARALGAEVTAVCSGRNAELVTRLGASRVIDYTKERVEGAWDAIFDVAGGTPISRCRRMLKPGGVYISSYGAIGWVLKAALASLLPGPRVVVFTASSSPALLDSLRELVDAGKVTVTIDRRYQLAQVPEALRYLGEGRTRGKSVITITAP